MTETMDELKRMVFYGMLDLAGRVFIVTRHSGNVVIGNRGFTEDEKRQGIVLVFNNRMQFSWGDSGISATLVFGASPQKCFIPAEDIIVIYSPELNAQFATGPVEETKTAGSAKKEKEEGETPKTEKASQDSKVVKVDFRKKK
jgi:hypothetical protein